jgi:hypothetical protein
VHNGGGVYTVCFSEHAVSARELTRARLSVMVVVCECDGEGGGGGGSYVCASVDRHTHAALGPSRTKPSVLHRVKPRECALVVEVANARCNHNLARHATDDNVA